MNSDPLLNAAIDGRYVIISRLARGGMASVYHAHDTRLERDVAVKIIHSHLAEQPDFVERFIREARSAAKLSSPHVVNVYDQGVAHTPIGELPYLVMQLITGPDLRSQLAQHGSLPLGMALTITRQVLQALAVAHQADVIHRDVKPENILLDKPLDINAVLDKPVINAQVADFGLARAASSATQTATVLGTVAYVAPELVTNGSAGPTADIYAVGIMLYELIAGTLPYDGETPVAIAYQHVNGDIPYLTELADWMPAHIDSLIRLFTAKDPYKRPRDAFAALDALDDIIRSTPEDIAIRRIPVFPRSPAATPPTATQQITSQNFTPVATTGTQRIETLTQASNTATLPKKAQLKPQPTLPERKKRRLWPIILFLILLVASIASTTGWYFLYGPGMRITIADVQNLTAIEATEKLQEQGFTISTVREFSDTVEKDHVISTSPKGGSSIHPDSVITVTISDGIRYLTVPTVAGKTAEEARELLTATGFNKISEITDYSDTVEKGTVISQSPEADASIPHNTEVSYIVSQGRAPVTIPDLATLTRADAEEKLSSAGLTPIITEEYSDTIPEGQVISQSPQANTAGLRLDEVNIVISKGPELIEVPNVVGQQSGSATTRLKNAGFNVQVEKILGGFFGTVRLQDPEAGTMIKPGSTIKISVV